MTQSWQVGQGFDGETPRSGDGLIPPVDKTLRTFFLRKNSQTEVTVVDARAIQVYTHGVERYNQKGDKYYVTALCTNQPDCPLCEKGYYKSFGALFTIVDHSKWTDRNNVEHHNEVKIMLVKTAGYDSLKALAQHTGDLRGKALLISRSGGDQSLSAGDNISVLGNSTYDISNIAPIEYGNAFFTTPPTGPSVSVNTISHAAPANVGAVGGGAPAAAAGGYTPGQYTQQSQPTQQAQQAPQGQQPTAPVEYGLDDDDIPF